MAERPTTDGMASLPRYIDDENTLVQFGREKEVVWSASSVVQGLEGDEVRRRRRRAAQKQRVKTVSPGRR